MNKETYTISAPFPSERNHTVLFVTATRKEKKDTHFKNLSTYFLENIIIPDGVLAVTQVIYGNTSGLPKLYNEIMESEREYDIYIFLHDDVVVNDSLLYNKLFDAEKRGRDVVGVAGSKGFEIPNPDVPTGWWSPPNQRHGLAGAVNHLQVTPNGQEMSCMTSYGPCPSRVLAIDGCFICLMNEGRKLRFNETFDFNHYDTALCMDAYKQGMNVGVEPIFISHKSPGQGFLKPEFLESQRKFIKEYFKV